MKSENVKETITIDAENIGGINRTEATFTGGVTILVGRNATNRTSLLQAIMAGIGSDNVSLKADADEGHVELEVGDELATRTLERSNGIVTTGGDPYLADPELADLFAFLLESNEARRAVERGDDLHEIIMRPVDMAAIEDEIEHVKAERRRIDEELESIEQLKEELPRLERRKQSLEGEIEEKRTKLREIEDEIEAVDTDVEKQRRRQEDLEDLLDELRETRSDLEDVRYDIDSEQESIESLREERTDLETRLDELPDSSTEDISELQNRIEELRDRRRNLESALDELQSVVQFNENILDGGDTPLDDFGGVASGGPVTDRLLDESVVCWTCGTEVNSDQIESTLDRLREFRQDKLSKSNEVERELEDLRSRQEELERQQRERTRLERKLEEVETEIDERAERLEDLRERRAELQAEVEELEEKVEKQPNEDFDELLELHRDANELEFELGRLNGDLDDVAAEIESIEERLAEHEELETQRGEVQSELEELRTRIERIENDAADQFNEHMEQVLDILDFDNIERVWIERVQRTERDGRRKVTTTAFDLHVIRSTASGTTYEDTIEHLSESERETIAIVFALAGYLVHDVHEDVPFVLLDSLEAFDASRIGSLVEYVSEFADNLVVALLPEVASVLDDGYERVTEI